MQILTHARYFLAAVAVAVTGTAASATSVAPHDLSTLASFDVDGAYALSSSSFGTKLVLDGTFAGDATGLLAIDPGKPMDFWFGASVRIDGHEILGGTLPVQNMAFGDIVTDTMMLLGKLDKTLGGLLTDLLDDGDANLFGLVSVNASVSDVVTTSTGISGAFEVKAKSFLNIAKVFCMPFGKEGTFDIALTIKGKTETHPSPVPLPAGAPLLLVALGGIAGLRRFRRS